MSVLFEYFRAPDRTAALRLLEPADGNGGTPSAPTEAGADALDAKGIDSTVTLGQLLAFVLEVPWDVDLVPSELVWPGAAPASDAEAEALPDDSPWNSGVTVEELGDKVRDGLAGVEDAAVPSLAERWSRIEEFGDDGDAESLGTLLGDLIGLARRARAENERIFSWCCV